MRYAITTLAALLVAGVAGAQTSPTESEIKVTISPSISNIGADECEEAVEVTRTFEVNLTGDFSDYELRLTYGSTADGCGEADVALGDCDETVAGASGDVLGEGTSFGNVKCRCIAAVDDGTKVTAEGGIEGLPITNISNICALVGANTEQKLYFVGWWIPKNTPSDGEDGDTGDETELSAVSSAAVVVTIDREGPEPPESPPSVNASEGALKVKVTTVSQSDDVEKYQACVRPVTEASPDGDVNSEVCKTTDAADAADDVDEIKVAGLTNGQCYCVAYRAIDGADNTGEFSPWSCCFTPEPLLDFAELYRERGGLETGGCDVSGSAPSGALLLGCVAVLGLIRRRQR